MAGRLGGVLGFILRTLFAAVNSGINQQLPTPMKAHAHSTYLFVSISSSVEYSVYINYNVIVYYQSRN